MAYLPASTKSKTTKPSKPSSSKPSSKNTTPTRQWGSKPSSGVTPVKGRGGKFFKVNPFSKKASPPKGEKVRPGKSTAKASGKTDASIHLKGTTKNAHGNPAPIKTQPANTAPAPAAPFLTPAQQKAVSDYDTTFGYNQGKLQRDAADATYTTNQDLADALHTHDVNTDEANQTMAARGLFQSSIRAGDLNDIDATLAMRNNILNTTLHSKLIDNGAQSGKLTTDWSVFHNYYNSLAVQNAQSITPATTNPTPPAGATKPPGSSGTKTTSSTPTSPPKQYNPGAIPGVAVQYVQHAAANGVPWAQQLANSPWAGKGPNTAAGWKSAGYGA